MKTNNQYKARRIIILAFLFICLLGYIPLLVGCNQEFPSEDMGKIVPTSNNADALSTVTPTQGEKAAEVAAQESSDSYVSDPDDCNKAVKNKQMEGCVSLESVQEITHPVWEQLFPDTEFYSLYLSNNNQIHMHRYTTYYRLVARQDNRQYTAETFNQLLSVNNIRVTNENYELVAQAFALMTLNAEIFTYQIAFTHWEPIDFQDAFSHYDRQLSAWTELGGQANQWRFGFEEGKMMEIMGPYVTDTEVGDYVPLSDIIPLPDIVDENHSYATGLSSQYRFFFDY